MLPAIYVVLALRAAMPLVVPPSGDLCRARRHLHAARLADRGPRRPRHRLVRAQRGLRAGRARARRRSGPHPRRHVLPAALGHVASQATLLLPAFILAEATLSYVGLGFPDTTPTWGTMLQDAANVALLGDAPWTLAPAAAIFVVVAGREPPASGPRPRPCTMSRHVSPPLQSPQRPFAGIYTPIATPFQADGTVDEAALRRNVARWMQTPLTGLVVLGSNGEAASAGRRRSRPRGRDRARGRAARPPVHRRHRPRVHPRHDRGRPGAPRTPGADAVLVRTPSFFKAQMTTDVLDRHYTRGGRRLAGAGAALQRHDVHGRDAARRTRWRGWPNTRTSSA